MENLGNNYFVFLVLALLFFLSCSNQDKGTTNIEQIEKQKEFTSLKEAIKTPNEVYRLTLQNDLRFKEFPKEILTLQNLRVLSFTGSECDFQSENNPCVNIQKLPGEIEELEKIEELYLVMNELEDLPNSIENLKNLKILDLSENRGINPQNAFRLTQLEKLHLNNCSIEMLDLDISNMKNLKVLGLSANNFSNEQQAQIRKTLPNCEIYFWTKVEGAEGIAWCLRLEHHSKNTRFFSGVESVRFTFKKIKEGFQMVVGIDVLARRLTTASTFLLIFLVFGIKTSLGQNLKIEVKDNGYYIVNHYDKALNHYAGKLKPFIVSDSAFHCFEINPNFELSPGYSFSIKIYDIINGQVTLRKRKSLFVEGDHFKYKVRTKNFGYCYKFEVVLNDKKIKAKAKYKGDPITFCNSIIKELNLKMDGEILFKSG